MKVPGRRAWAGLASGVFLIALGGCTGLANSRRDSAEAHYHMASAYLQQEGGIQSDVNRRAAFPEVRQAVEFDPRNAYYHQLLGTIYLYNEELQLAESSVRRALELNPGLAQASNNLGLILLSQGRLMDAAAQFRKALADMAYPTPEIAYYNLGKTLFRLSDYAAAAEAYERSLAILPGNEEGRLELGLSYARLGRLAEAEKSFTAALKMRPDAPRTHYELGMVLFKLGRREQAVEQFRAVVELDPSSDLGAQAQTYLKLLR